MAVKPSFWSWEFLHLYGIRKCVFVLFRYGWILTIDFRLQPSFTLGIFAIIPVSVNKKQNESVCDFYGIHSGLLCQQYWKIKCSYDVNSLSWRIYASVNWTNISSDNGLSPCRRQAIIWTSAVIIGPMGTNFSEISIKMYTVLFTKMHLKMSFGKWQPPCLGLNMIIKEYPMKYSYGWGIWVKSTGTNSK